MRKTEQLVLQQFGQVPRQHDSNDESDNDRNESFSHDEERYIYEMRPCKFF